MSLVRKMMRLNLLVLYIPLPKLYILGRQGLETWENRGREVGEPNERVKGGQGPEIQDVLFEAQNNFSSR